LVQGSPKRNIAIAQRGNDDSASRCLASRRLKIRNELFDGDRESADQPRNLVQILGILGIMFLDGLGQSEQHSSSLNAGTSLSPGTIDGICHVRSVSLGGIGITSGESS
jgi:hypothetical protein